MYGHKLKVQDIWWTYLWVGELQTSDGEHDFSSSDEEILWNLPSDVNIVGLDILHLFEC